MGNLGFQELILIFFALGIALIPAILYLISLQNALKIISPENRKIEPGNVWLVLIPIFNIVCVFIVVEAIGTSFKQEYEKFGVSINERPTYNIGLTMAILHACSIIPIVGILARLGAFACWIMHWIKVVETKKELERIKNEYELSVLVRSGM